MTASASPRSTTVPPRGELLRAPESIDSSEARIAAFARAAARSSARAFADYRDLWEWSVADLPGFWSSVVDFFALRIEGHRDVLGTTAPPRAQWFPGARLSYPEHALRRDPAGPALIGISQTRDRTELTMAELRDAVARCRTGLIRLGVTRGDRVVGYLPNIPEAVVAFLATASLGAIWATCPPEFGARAVVDRLAQIEPKVLITVDGYRYGDKDVDRRETVAAVRRGLPSVEHTVLVDYLGLGGVSGLTWEGLLGEPGALTFAQVDFDHPLYVLFSSGTTGLPKAIVHGHGGMLLEHVKALGLHNDVRPGDRFFWHSTTGWMVWNYAVSALLVGATVVCFDGNPSSPTGDGLWRLVADEQVTYFGTSAGHLIASRVGGLTPGTAVDLSALRGLGSTGSPLPAEEFRWVYEAVSQDIHLSSISGGTDICSAFVGGSPLSPVRAGEISAPALGVDVAALDADGRRVTGEFGELSVLAPMPSMPVALWGDDGTRLLHTYFARHEGVWSHGDWALFHDDLSCVIAGRSDATLNRGGVRLGTADFYPVVDAYPGVEDSVIVHLDGEGTEELVLLVAVHETAPAGDVREGLRATIRRELSPRHVPDRVVVVRQLPRTLTGKRLEKPIKQILLGADPETVVSRDSVVHPEGLDEIRRHRVGGELPLHRSTTRGGTP